MKFQNGVEVFSYKDGEKVGFIPMWDAGDRCMYRFLYNFPPDVLVRKVQLTDPAGVVVEEQKSNESLQAISIPYSYIRPSMKVTAKYDPETHLICFFIHVENWNEKIEQSIALSYKDKVIIHVNEKDRKEILEIEFLCQEKELDDLLF